MPGEKETVHFIGIGGAGMSGIAKVLLELGYPVQGSDLKKSETTDRLSALGATIFQGHKAENITDDIDLVVVSSAVPEDNVEVIAARGQNIKIIQRAEMLAKLMQWQKGIAIAGAHGKTTTTSMISMVLEKNNLDPTVVIGGELNDIGGNAKLGHGEYLVAEADESDGSFLKLDPDIIVITNIEDDHLDYYGSVDNIIAAFGKFLDKVPETGFAVLCNDNQYVRDLAGKYEGNLYTYALSAPADYTVTNIQLSGFGSTADVHFQGEYLGALELSVPGQHNIANALAAIAVGRAIGLKFDQIKEALKGFHGAKRRFQLVGQVNGVIVVDDYAHHPTEIKATLKAAKQVDTERIIAVFQPHRYTRTYFLKEEFGKAFSDADLVIINTIYAAGEKPIPGVSAELIADLVKENGGKVLYFGDLADTEDYLYEHCHPGDLILTMGAGNIWTVGYNLVERLKRQTVTM